MRLGYIRGAQRLNCSGRLAIEAAAPMAERTRMESTNRDARIRVKGVDVSLPEIVLRVERTLREHPGAIGIFTVLVVAALVVGHLFGTSDFPLALTYAFPLAVCAYAIGLAAGVTTAAALAIIWFWDALSRGVGQNEAALI